MDFNLQDLTSPDWQTCQTAVNRLLNQADAHTLERLLRVIKDRQDDLGLLNAALQVLQRNALPVIASLAELLQDDDVDTRIYAAQALGQVRHGAAVPLLLEALEDPNPNVRYHAIDSLGHLRAAQAVPALLEYLKVPDFFLTFPAIEALAHIGDPSILPDLLPLLQDDILAPAVVEALGALASPSDLPPLLEWMASPAADIPLACKALRRVWERHPQPRTWVPRLVSAQMPPPARQRVLQAARQGGTQHLVDVIAVLGWLEGQDVHQALIALLRREETRAPAMQALASSGRAVLPAVLKTLPTVDEPTRLALARLLGTLGDARAVPALVAMLSASDPHLVIEAATALGKIGARDALDALLEQLRHPSGLVRRAVVSAINSLGHPEHTARLLPLAEDPDPRVRAAAIDSLGYFADPEAEACLLRALEDPADVVQQAAVKALGVMDTPRARQALAEAAQSPHARVRATAMQAVAPSEWGRALLHSGLQDPDAWVRLYACRGLALLSPQPESTHQLIALARSDPALHVRLTAIQSAGLVGGAEAWQALTALLDDPLPDVREAALQALAALPPGAEADSLAQSLFARAPEERLRFVQGLRANATAGSVRMLRLLAQGDPEFDVRYAALQALRDMPLDAAADALVALLEQSPDELQVLNMCLRRGLACLPPLFSRLRALRLLQAWAGQSVEAHNAVLDLSRDDDPEVRLAAVQSLALLPRLRTLERLHQIAAEDPSPQIRSAAQHILRQQGG